MSAQEYERLQGKNAPIGIMGPAWPRQELSVDRDNEDVIVDETDASTT